MIFLPLPQGERNIEISSRSNLISCASTWRRNEFRGSDTHYMARGGMPYGRIPETINHRSQRQIESSPNQIGPVQATITRQIPNEHGRQTKQHIKVCCQQAVWKCRRQPLNAINRSREGSRDG